jgi:hypothetical protein
MPTYKNLSPNDLPVVQKSVRRAGLLLAKAKTKLITPDSKMKQLLGDAFGVAPTHWNDGTARIAVTKIVNVLDKIVNCMARSRIIYASKPPADASQFACYVIVNTRRMEVFLTKRFFGGYSTVELAAYLAHEYVHLAHWPHGHPGVAGEQLAVLFARSPLGIPPHQSVNNAYCYQYFMEWLAEEFPG